MQKFGEIENITSIGHITPPSLESPTYISEMIPQVQTIHSVIPGSTYEDHMGLKIHKIASSKIGKRDDYMQLTIKKDMATKEWLLKDKKLNAFSSDVIEEVKSIFQDTSSVEACSIELVKEELPGLPDDLTMYISLSKKVSREEMMELWKRISAKSVEIIRKLAINQNEFEEILDKTTITLQRC